MDHWLQFPFSASAPMVHVTKVPVGRYCCYYCSDGFVQGRDFWTSILRYSPPMSASGLSQRQSDQAVPTTAMEHKREERALTDLKAKPPMLHLQTD